MKCTNCNTNEVNFYYTSNINGKITKYSLCSECAEKMGLTESVTSAFAAQRKKMNSIMDNFFGGLFSRDPFALSGIDSEFPLPSFSDNASTVSKTPEGEGASCCGSCGTAEETEKITPDPELSKRRELNALRYEMKAAAEREDFEKAAEIRDKIKALEESKD